ncbi:VapE domain-containing protein [Serratia marcescens]|uniref:VapE domain-containing protein n=1 Tax=Serratia marcescens TaxID=615 RepID=UPI003D176A3D
MEIRYSQGRNAEDGQPREMSVPDFDTFERQIRDNATCIGVRPTDDKDALNQKKRRLPYVWHAFKTGAARRRRADSAGDLCFLPMDLDGVTAGGWESIKAVLADYRGFSYTTASHLHPTANGEHRIRIVLAPSRPITAEEKPRVLQQLQAEVMDIIDLVYDGPARWDSHVYNPAQMLFLPDEHAVFESFSGQSVDVDALLQASPVSVVTACPEREEPDDLDRLVMLDTVDDNTFADLRSALWHPAVLADAEPDCGKYPSWAAMGNRLAWFKGTDWEGAARQLWVDWSIAGGGDGASAEQKWDSDQLTAERTGYQAIFARASKDGWVNPGAERLREATVAKVGDFDVVPVGASDPAPLPAFERDKFGRIEAIIENVTAALLRPDFTGVAIRFDQFRDEIMLAPEGTEQWRSFGDEDYGELRITLGKLGFKAVGKELIRDSVLVAAKRQPFDSAMTWLESLKWDGVPRINRFYHTHFGTEDSAYTRAVSLYMWTALAGRVLSPGCKADMVPILVGAQGLRKSSGIAALSPDPEFFADISFADKDDDLARKMRGCLVAEISELRGLNTKDLESIKAWVARTHDKWVPKFREFTNTFARRGIPLGSSNEDEFLADRTGNRRWLPVNVTCLIDVNGIERDRECLWAEARDTFKRLGGVQFREAERLSTAVHEQYTIKDAWLETVERWLDEPDLLTEATPRSREFLRATDVLRDALNLDPKNIGKREEMRISSILQACGYQRVQRRVDGKVARIFEPV